MTSPCLPDDAAAWLAQETASRLWDRLEYIRHAPRCIVDVGCGTGRDAVALAQRYPEAEVWGVDLDPRQIAAAQQRIAPTTGWRRWLPEWLRADAPKLSRPERLRFACAPADALPLADGSVDFLWSNLLLHHLVDPVATLKAWRRVLAPEGMLLFATLGPDTLKELRAVWGEARIVPFTDMHDIGDWLVATGFRDPVMDMQFVTIRYQSLEALWRDLRGVAAGNPGGRLPKRSARKPKPTASGLVTPRRWKERSDRAREALRGDDGTFTVTVELVFGHAWQGKARTDSPVRWYPRARPLSPGKTQ